MRSAHTATGNQLPTKLLRTFNEDRMFFLTNGAGKTGYPHAEEIRHLSLTGYKNELKMDSRP
jgi:hypothetical protein